MSRLSRARRIASVFSLVPSGRLHIRSGSSAHGQRLEADVELPVRGEHADDRVGPEEEEVVVGVAGRGSGPRRCREVGVVDRAAAGEHEVVVAVLDPLLARAPSLHSAHMQPVRTPGWYSARIAGWFSASG
jgi:hypothetical protein